VNALQGIGSILLIAGIVALVWGIYSKLRAGRVAGAPLAHTGDVAARGAAAAGDKGAVSVEGAVACAQPLVSPVTGTPCLYWELRVTKAWKAGQTRHTKQLAHEKRAAAFQVDDGSGPVAVDASQGGDFEPTQNKSESKGTGFKAGITGGELAFGNYRLQVEALTLGSGVTYHVEERVLPVVPKLYVCGKTDAGPGAIGAPSWRQLIVSNKSRDEILGAAMKGARVFLPAGIGASAVAIGMLVAGNFLK
jgi:hypothetical protein